MHDPKSLIRFIVLAISGVFVLAFLIAPEISPAADADKWLAPVASQGKKNPVAGDATALQNGKKIYEKECASCHGKKGLGDGPKAVDLSKTPGNLTTGEFKGQTDGEIFWKITQGKKPMPSFKNAYTDDERWGVVDYVRSFAK
jgi:mono/diheme cytochrome c family protein